MVESWAMARRRTRNEKLRAQTKTPQLKVVIKKEVADPRFRYFREDLVKSLAIILLILAIELVWWWFKGR
jgi:hypothetical protein